MSKRLYIIAFFTLFATTFFAQETLTKDDISFRGYFSEALKFYTVKDYQRAEQTLNKAIEIEKNDATYFLEYQILKAQKKNVEAINALENAETSAPNNPWYHYYLALEYKELGMAKQAIAELEQAIKLDNKNRDAYKEIIMLALQNSDLNTALEYTNKYEQKFGISTKTIDLKLSILSREKDTAGYIKALNNYIRHNKIPKQYYYIKLAELNMETNPGTAEKYIDSTLAIDKDNRDALIYKSYLLTKQKEYDSAASALLHIDDFTGLYSRVYFMLDSMTKNIEPCKANSLLEKFYDTGNKQAQKAYLKFLWENAGFDILDSLLSKKIEKKHYQIDNFLTLSLVYVLKDKYQELLKLSKLALEVYPSHPEFYILEAFASEKLGKEQNKIINYLNQAQLLDFDGTYDNIINLMKGNTTKYIHQNTLTVVLAVKLCKSECLESINNKLQMNKPVNYYLSYIIESELGNYPKADSIKNYLYHKSLLNKKCNE